MSAVVDFPVKPEARPYLEAFGHGTVADLMRVAVFVELEKLRRQRLAAVVALALVAVDAHLQQLCSGHRASSWREPIGLICNAN